MGAAEIKALRQRTGAGILDCKKALTESDGDIDKAIDWLRAKGMARAAKKAGRAATEGLVVSYIHAGGKIGVLVEVLRDRLRGDERRVQDPVQRHRDAHRGGGPRVRAS